MSYAIHSESFDVDWLLLILVLLLLVCYLTPCILVQRGTVLWIAQRDKRRPMPWFMRCKMLISIHLYIHEFRRIRPTIPRSHGVPHGLRTQRSHPGIRRHGPSLVGFNIYHFSPQRGKIQLIRKCLSHLNHPKHLRGREFGMSSRLRRGLLWRSSK
ncbi:hypothetical protein DENSPDRAFT_285268 [Dentipellis sp. KUC8613]|nr:hypothetical protein DENSPDRAFT_285268 [Dentipellis sp. KUC8613]